MTIQVAVLAAPPGDSSPHVLTQAGMAAAVFPDRAALLAGMRRHLPDLVLLHHRPGENAVLETLKALRALAPLPCILRAVRGDDPVLRIAALEAGADDCLPVAITQREMLARLRAVLRRAAPPSLAHNGWRLSAERRDLFTPTGAPCHLTTAEFELLRNLMHSSRAVSREELSQRVFRRPYSPADRAVDNLVARLRRKLEPQDSAPVIKAVRGVGYAFLGFPEDQHTQVETPPLREL